MMQQPGFTAVPFSGDSSSGLASFNGIAKFSTAGIILEFEKKLFGLITDGVKEVRIPTEEILDIKFKKGIFRRSGKIELRTRSFSLQAELPSDNGKLRVKVKREDMQIAQEAVERMKKLVEEAAAALPPPQVPVSDLFEAEEDQAKTKELPK